MNNRFTRYTLEARTAPTSQGGQLKFDCPQPPAKHLSEDELFDIYFRDPINKDASGATHEQLRAYFANKHWYYREVTWR